MWPGDVGLGVNVSPRRTVPQAQLVRARDSDTAWKAMPESVSARDCGQPSVPRPKSMPSEAKVLVRIKARLPNRASDLMEIWDYFDVFRYAALALGGYTLQPVRVSLKFNDKTCLY